MRVYPVKFGSYSLLGPLGEGPLGDIHRALIDSGPLASQPLVIKRISPLFSRERRFRDSFLARAAVVAQIQHPHLMPIVDKGELEGCLFTVTELTGALSLQGVMAHLRTGGLPIPQNLAVALVLQLCEGVEVLRRQKVGEVPLVHGNIKPSNILVDNRGVARLTDVCAGPGLAGPLSQVWWVARDGLPYMAPELLSGRPPEPQADVFALASLLSELLTLTPLVEITSPFETLQRLARLDLKAVMGRLTQAGFSREFVELMEWALDPDPDRRLEDASSFADALAELGPGEGMWVTPDSYWTDLLAAVQGIGGDKPTGDDAGWDLMALDMMAAGAAMELEGDDVVVGSPLSNWDVQGGHTGSGLRLVDADVASVASLESLVSSSLAMDPSLDETAEFRADEADDDLDMTPRAEVRARPEISQLSHLPPRDEVKVVPPPAPSGPSPARSRASWNTGPLVVMSEELAQEPEEDDTFAEDDGSGDDDDGGFEEDETSADDEGGFEGEDGDDADEDDEEADEVGNGMGDGESVDDALAAEEADNLDDEDAGSDADEGVAEYAGEEDGDEAGEEDGAAHFPAEEVGEGEEDSEEGDEPPSSDEMEAGENPSAEEGEIPSDYGAEAGEVSEAEAAAAFDAAALSFFKEGDPMLRDTLVLSREQVAKMTGRPARTTLSAPAATVTTPPPAATTPPVAAPRTVILPKSEIQRLLKAELGEVASSPPVVEPPPPPRVDPPRSVPAALGERSSLGPLWPLLSGGSGIEVMEAGSAEEDEESPPPEPAAALDETSLFFDVMAMGAEPADVLGDDETFSAEEDFVAQEEDEPIPEGVTSDEDEGGLGDEEELGGVPTEEEAAAALDMTGEEVVDAFAAFDAQVDGSVEDVAGAIFSSEGEDPTEVDVAAEVVGDTPDQVLVGGYAEHEDAEAATPADDDEEDPYRTTDELPAAMAAAPAEEEAEVTPVDPHLPEMDPSSPGQSPTLSGFSTLDGEGEPLDDVGDLIAEFDGAITLSGRSGRRSRPTEVLEQDPLHDPDRLRRVLAEGGKRRSPLPDGTVMDGVLQVVRRVEVGPSRAVYEAIPNQDVLLRRCWECGYTRNTRADNRCSRCHEVLNSRTFVVSCRWDKRLVEREIAMAGRNLAHPALGRIYGFLAHEGMICRILDVRGSNVFTFKGRNLAPAQAIRIGIDLCSAGAYLAELGVSVVDMMPANVLLTEGGAQLYDPDVAEVTEGPASAVLRARTASSIARLLAGHIPLEAGSLQAVLAGPSAGHYADPSELASALGNLQGEYLPV